jgi:hypothetical protein
MNEYENNGLSHDVILKLGELAYDLGQVKSLNIFKPGQGLIAKIHAWQDAHKAVIELISAPPANAKPMRVAQPRRGSFVEM